MFAANGETVRGVLQVFNELNVKDKTVVSINGKEDEWAWMTQGKEAASVPNPPSLNADLTVQQIVRYLTGQKFEKYLQIMPSVVLTKDNLAQAVPWDTNNYMKARAANAFKWDLAWYEDQYLKNKAKFDNFDAKLTRIHEGTRQQVMEPTAGQASSASPRQPSRIMVSKPNHARHAMHGLQGCSLQAVQFQDRFG